MTHSQSRSSSRFEVLTFDCYGTLIDWETGIRRAFARAVARTHAKPDLVEQAVQLYEEEERRVEKEKPFKSYRNVLAESTIAVAEKIGLKLKQSDASFLADELPSWTPFPDTNPALDSLARHHRLGILSNIDNDLLAETLKHLNTRFDILVTAENVRSYKPDRPHFERAREIIGTKKWAHVAASQYHDIEPGLALGIPAFWVNRKKALPNQNYSGKDVTIVQDLKELVSNLG